MPNLVVLRQRFDFERAYEKIRQKKTFASRLLRLLKAMGTDIDRSATYDFLLVMHSNHMGLSRIVSEIKSDICKILTFRASDDLAEEVPLGIL